MTNGEQFCIPMNPLVGARAGHYVFTSDVMVKGNGEYYWDNQTLVSHSNDVRPQPELGIGLVVMAAVVFAFIGGRLTK